MSNPYSRRMVSTNLAGDVIQVDVDPASRWIGCVAASGGVLGLLTGLTSPAVGDRLTNRVLDGLIFPEDASRAAETLLTRASPYTWWKTLRLLSLSCRDDICGHLTLAGLSPSDLTVAQWCTAVYTLVTKDSDAKGKFKTDAAFDDPPIGIIDDGWMSDREFNAMVAAARNAPGQT